MSGNKIGGRRAAATNLAIDPDFYKRIGALGGAKGNKDGTIKGFAANRRLASMAGSIGGRKSRRGPSKITKEGEK